MQSNGMITQMGHPDLDGQTVKRLEKKTTWDRGSILTRSNTMLFM